MFVEPVNKPQLACCFRPQLLGEDVQELFLVATVAGDRDAGGLVDYKDIVVGV